MVATKEPNFVIKLTEHRSSGHDWVIQAEGYLDGEAVAQFRGLIAPERAIGSLTVELSGLTSVDHEGRAFLKGLREAGCRLRGASLYIRTLLEEVRP